MKKVVHVILGKANPDRMNGVNKVVNSLATAQSKLRYPVEVWGLSKKPNHDYPERNYHTKLYKDHGKYRLSLQLINDIRTEKEKNTIFHFHGAFILQFALIARILRLCQIEYAVNLHGGYNRIALKRSRYKKRLYYLLVDRKYLNWAKFIQIIGKSEKTGLEDFKIRTKIILIPNGQAYIPHRVVKVDSPQFVFCGRMDLFTKGLDILLEGFALSIANGLNAKLKLIGGGPDFTDVVGRVHVLGIQDYVEFKGELYGQLKWDVILNSTSMILTSRNEGLPGVVLESLALNVPVIVSEPTNMGEVVTKYGCGILLDSNTPEKLSDAITHMCSKIGIQQYDIMCSACNEAVANEYSWFNIASDLRLNYCIAS